MKKIKIEKCNDLYFPNGNEFGEYYEPYYKASQSGISCYGSSPSLAEKALIKKLLEEDNELRKSDDK